MTQKLISLEEQLAAIKKSWHKQLKPKVRSFEEFNTLEALCAELAKRLDREPPHDGLEPYCGVPLARALISLCKQLFVFECKQNDSFEDEVALGEILNEYITGAAPFIRLSEAYGLNSELNSFMRIHPDPSNVEISEETYDDIEDPYNIPDEPYNCCVEPDGYEWYDDPIGWMFPDEESFLAYQVRQLELQGEEYARQVAESEPLEEEDDPPYRVLFKMSSEQIRLVKPFAREFFLAKAIEYCSMSEGELSKAEMIEFPFDDFSPEGRKRIEEQSDENFIKLYNMTASEEGLKAGIQFVNRALQSFDDEFIRRVVEADRK